MVIRQADLPELADRKTDTDYREAQNPLLWWFAPDNEHFMGYRDPAAAEPVQFRSMYRWGASLTVYYTLPEKEEQVYRARLRQADPGVQLRIRGGRDRPGKAGHDPLL